MASISVESKDVDPTDIEKRNISKYVVGSITSLKHKGTKWNIKLTHILLIEGYSRKKINLFIPQTVIDLILFFYAKPLNMRLIWDKQMNIITYCPINNKWKSIMNKIRTIYGLHPCHPIKVQSKNKNIILDKNNWNNGQWNDNEEFIFSLEISIHEMKEYVNESVIKIQNALITVFNEDVSVEFIKFIIEEQFDEESLKEEIEEDWGEYPLDCCFIEYLVDIFPHLFNTDKQQKQLLKLLDNAINDKFNPQKIESINLNEIEWTVTEEKLKKTKQLWTKQYSQTVHEGNKPLIEVLCIGKQNNIPLLNWLTDTFSRYRINQYILNNESVISCSDWLCKEYWLYKEFRRKHKQRVVEKLHCATRSFFTGHGCGFIPILNLNEPYLLIDDDINAFAVYFMAMSEAIDNLVEIQDGYIVPFQIDMLIIPKQVSKTNYNYFYNDSDDDTGDFIDDDEDDDDFDEFGVKAIGNIDERLKASHFRYRKRKNNDSKRLKRLFVQEILSQINDRRNQRIIIYVDRRNPKYNNNNNNNNSNIKKWDDSIYIVQSSNRSYNELPKYDTALTSFDASIKCMLPPKIQQNNNLYYSQMYGCRDSLDGFQFTLSWHINSKHLIRCYWFVFCGGTRFFPSDAISIWPIYFKNHSKINKKISDKLTQMKQIKDEQFVNWYENTTKSKLLSPLNNK